MDYKKAYEEALEKARTYYNNKPLEAERKKLEEMFPQLRESEDEKIKKAIKLVLIATEDDQDVFYRTHGITRKECTDWLEKQGGKTTIEFNDAPTIDNALNDYVCKQYKALAEENGGVLSFARLQHLAMDIQKWCKEQNQ